MTDLSLPTLCGAEGCRLLAGHTGKHDAHPTRAWAFMQQRDKDKLTKAGFATPRGGNKGAYQNHVLRSNKVIVPYERLRAAPLDHYRDGYVIRLYPEQYFAAAGGVRESFVTGEDAWVKVGENAFILYRTHDGYESLPPLAHWRVRSLLKDGAPVKERGKDAEGLLAVTGYEYKGVIRHGLTSCPLCLRFIYYRELHEMVAFETAEGVENAAEQVEGATRSTIVNLFHLTPLRYDTIAHIPQSIAWGHAVCNTRLGQRECVSLTQIIEMGLKVGVLRPEGIETFGWITTDFRMIRSPNGAVWIQLNGDEADGPPEISELQETTA